jgi:ATP:ADP antiporter, AAA family
MDDDSESGRSGPSEGDLSGFERMLSLVAEVRPGEGRGAFLLALNVFLILSSYYLLKTVREALILSEGGAEIKSYSAAAQALLLLLVVPAYGVIASRFNRMRLIAGVTFFFISHLLLFAAAGLSGLRVGIPFFIWLGIFNVLVVAQFWAFANDVYTEQSGRRLFAIIGLGSVLGALAGAWAAGYLFARFGPFHLMVLGGIGLTGAVGLNFLVHSRQAGASAEEKAITEAPLERVGGFELIWKQRYLFLIALLVLLLNVVNSTGEFILGKLVVEAASEAAAGAVNEAETRRLLIGQFYGSFFGWVNLLCVVFQLFLVSRIFRFIGIRGALFILPLIAMGGNLLLIGFPILAVIQVAKILENGTDYSIQNTARNALFLTTSREAKYKAKAAIDTFFWRAGDVMQALVVLLGTSLGLSVRGFAALNLGFVFLWLIVVTAIHFEHRRVNGVLEPVPSG